MQFRNLFFIITWLFACSSLWGAEASPIDTCTAIDTTLRWTSIQPALFKNQSTALADTSKTETDLLNRFYKLIPLLPESKKGSNQLLLRLTQEMQNAITNSRKPSLALKQHWLALLLATEQSDVSYKILSQKKPGTRDAVDSFLLAESLFMQKKYKAARDQYKKTSPTSSDLLKYKEWRLAELDLIAGNATESWKHFQLVLRKRPAAGFTKDLQEALELDLIQFGLSRLDPLTLWKNVPPATNRERVAICVLNSPRSSNISKQFAFKELSALKVTSDLSIDFYRRNLSNLVNAKAARQSFITLIQSGLQAALYHKDPNSLDRKSLLVDLQKATQNLLVGSTAPDQVPTNKRLVAALDLFTTKGNSQETLLFRQVKATLLEGLGQWSRAAQEYQAILAISPDRTERGQLAWLMLKAYRKATPPINTGDRRLYKNDLEVAENLLRACDLFNTYWPHAENERRECENFTIQLAINQKQESYAVQKLWLFISHYPNQSADAIYTLLTLYRGDNATLISSCQKLLRIPELQSGQIADYLRDRLRTTQYEEIAKLGTPQDQAAAYASFAVQERPAPLALSAITRAIDLSQTNWQRRSDYLKIYIDKFPKGPLLLENYLQLAQLYEDNFSLRDAYNLLRSARQLPWSNDKVDRRNNLECRINMVEHPVEAIPACLSVAASNHRAPIELAKRLLWANEAAALNRLVTSEAFTQLSLNLNERVEVLGIAYDGTESVPAYRNSIRTALYDLYAENPNDMTSDSRRTLASIAYKVAQKALPAYLNMPIYAGRSDEIAPAIKAKHAAYAEIEALYSRVLGTKDPYWGSSALADLAVASANLSSSLRNVSPVEGMEAKALETQLNGPASQWAAKSKSYANASEKTLERYNLIHQDARRLKLDMQTLREEQILWTDAMPEWEQLHAF